MKIKKIKQLKVNSYDFKVSWNNSVRSAKFSYYDMTIEIGTKKLQDGEIFMLICHELMEICALEMHIRFDRYDCTTDYIFVYDHRQHDTMTSMFSGLLREFIC